MKSVHFNIERADLSDWTTEELEEASSYLGGISGALFSLERLSGDAPELFTAEGVEEILGETVLALYGNKPANGIADLVESVRLKLQGIIDLLWPVETCIMAEMLGREGTTESAASPCLGVVNDATPGGIEPESFHQVDGEIAEFLRSLLDHRRDCTSKDCTSCQTPRGIFKVMKDRLFASGVYR